MKKVLLIALLVCFSGCAGLHTNAMTAMRLVQLANSPLSGPGKIGAVLDTVLPLVEENTVRHPQHTAPQFRKNKIAYQQIRNNRY